MAVRSFSKEAFLEASYLKIKERNEFILTNEVNSFFSKDKSAPSLFNAKKHNICIAQSLKRLHPEEHNKFNKVFMCGDNISYTYSPKYNKTHIQGYFCDHRLCPVCNYYKSRAFFSRIYTYVKDNADKKFLFLTLTVPNCSAENLRATVLKMNRAFGKMFKLTDSKSKVSSMFSSYLRRTEVTYNLNPDSPFYKTFHPHMHIILECKPEYRPGSECFYHYSEILADWRKYMDDESITEVKISIIKAQPGENYDSGIAGAVAECCKYPFKMPTKLFHPNFMQELDEYISAVETLKGVRFESAAGEIKPILHFVSKVGENDTDICDSSVPTREEIENDKQSCYLELKWVPALSTYQLFFNKSNFDLKYGLTASAVFRLKHSMFYGDHVGLKARPK